MVWVPPGPFIAGEGATQHVETLNRGFWYNSGHTIISERFFSHGG